MTLEIEYPNGERHGVTPERYRFYPKSKKMILTMPKPYRTALYGDGVERKLTSHGVVYGGAIAREDNAKIKDNVKFFLYL